MTLIADILLISGAFGAALYCMILSRRLSRLSDLDGGLGKAIADLNAQVSDLSKTLQEARSSAAASAETLGDLTDRAEAVAGSLKTMLQDAAAMSEGLETKSRGSFSHVASAKDPVRAGRSDAGSEQAEPGGRAMPSFIRGRAVRTAAE